jgi:hypothetical protein
MTRTGMIAALVLASLSMPAQADMSLEKMLRGEPAMRGKKLKKAIAKAEAQPLGSRENPVRATMPQGQRAYLQRLRCANGVPPEFRRQGSAGPGPYGSIIDIYLLHCADSTPAEVTVFMDMYHGGYAENRAVPGFTMIDGAPPQ